MAKDCSFEEVLGFFEKNGWVLQRVHKPYRIFMKEGELPWLIPVHEGKVSYEYIKKINNYFESKDEQDPE